jgi:hypothetical protein
MKYDLITTVKLTPVQIKQARLEAVRNIQSKIYHQLFVESEGGNDKMLFSEFIDNIEIIRANKGRFSYWFNFGNIKVIVKNKKIIIKDLV